MTPLKRLTADLEQALARGDLDRARDVRRTIASEHAESDAAVEAHLRLGFDALFKRSRPDEALEHLRRAAKAKAPWSVTARIAVGIILLRQGKMQQAVFELRKAASASPPTALSASASGVLVMALRESGKAVEAERARSEHKKVLHKLTASTSPEEKALGHFMLGMEHKFDGDRREARAHLAAALSSAALPEAERREAESALRDL